jgi:hypothetical protein
LTRIGLPIALAAGGVVYGRRFNPLITLKALNFFDDLPKLPSAVKERLRAAGRATDATNLPILKPYSARPSRQS